MSHTTVLAPLVSALVKAEDILGNNRQWSSVNEFQQEFLDNFFVRRGELKAYSETELRNWVSWVASELNAILEKEGFSIKLDDFEPDTFGIVSILDVLVEWLESGEVTRIFGPDQHEYPGVEFKENFEVLKANNHKHPIVCLPTKSGDKVYMTIASKEAEGLELASIVDWLRADLRQSTHYDLFSFPMIDLNQEVDISWLLGLNTVQGSTGKRAHISQAKQQTKFKMNQHGARVKSAVALGITLEGCVQYKTLVIDRPFYLWIERSGAKTPVMYAYLDYEYWKDPGDLGSI